MPYAVNWFESITVGDTGR